MPQNHSDIHIYIFFFFLVMHIEISALCNHVPVFDGFFDNLAGVYGLGCSNVSLITGTCTLDYPPSLSPKGE